MAENTTNILGKTLIDFAGLEIFWSNAKSYIDGQDDILSAKIGEKTTEGKPASGVYAHIDGEISAAKTELTGAIGTAKTELTGAIGTAKTEAIEDAKDYTDKVAKGLTERIDGIIAGGVTFTGVVEKADDLTNKKVNGGVITVKSDVDEITVDDYTFKPGYEYIYYKPNTESDGVWYELGDSDKNAKAITDLREDIEGITIASEDDIRNIIFPIQA